MRVHRIVTLAGALTLSFSAAALVSERPALAQTDADKAEARRLAEEGSKALKRKDYGAAEAKFQAAVDLVPAPTLFLELGRAQEGRGKLASAAKSYERAITAGTAPKASAPFRQAAKEAAVALALVLPRVPGLVIVVRGGSNARVRLDGEDVAQGVRLPRDPGSHRVVVTAAGFKTATKAVDLPEAQAVRVELVLHPEEDEEPPPPPPPPPQLDPPPKKPRPRPYLQPLPPPPPPRGNPNTGVGAGLLVTGLVFMGGGGLTTGLAVAKHGDLAANCPNGKCDSSWGPAISEYEAVSWISPFAWAIGGVLTVSGIALLATPTPGGGSPVPQPSAPPPAPSGEPPPPDYESARPPVRRDAGPKLSFGVGPSTLRLRLDY